MKKIYSTLVVFTLLVTSISCGDDFLTQTPVGAYTPDVANTPAGLRTLLIGAYSLVNGTSGMATDPMQGLFGSIRGGEAHKGSITGDQPQMIEVQRYEMTSGNSSNQTFFQYYYNAIFRVNLVLETIPKVTPAFSATEQAQLIAECRFLRAHFHFMLKRLYKNVPYLDETNVIETRVPNTDASGNYVNIWPQIIADFDFAATNLALTHADLGRPNRWAAKSYLGKALLYAGNDGVDAAANYGRALVALNDVITNGVNNRGTKYALYANYHQNFDANTAMENGSEWVWGAQNSILDGSSATGANGNAFIQYSGQQNATGPGLCNCYNFFAPSQWYVNYFRVDANGLPVLDATARNANGIKSYAGAYNAATFVPDAGPIDPRLDWTVGRVGIPYLDFGLFQDGWVRAPLVSSIYFSKKQFIRKAEQSTLGGGAFNAMNAAVIRFADVLLMAAELEARTSAPGLGQANVNLVRNRMRTNTASAENRVKNLAGTADAANYQIGLYTVPWATKADALRAIFMERELELGLEGHSAYDLVRFGNAGDTDTNGKLMDDSYFNGYIDFESKKTDGRGSYLAGGSYVKATDQLMPIPQQAINFSFKDGSVTLKQNPGY